MIPPIVNIDITQKYLVVKEKNIYVCEYKYVYVYTYFSLYIT